MLSRLVSYGPRQIVKLEPAYFPAVTASASLSREATVFGLTTLIFVSSSLCSVITFQVVKDAFGHR